MGGFIIEGKEKKKRLQGSNEWRGRGTNGLTFFGVTGSILAGMTHHPIGLVPRPVLQHVIPEIHTKETGHWLELTLPPQAEPQNQKKKDSQKREEECACVRASKSV